MSLNLAFMGPPVEPLCKQRLIQYFWTTLSGTNLLVQSNDFIREIWAPRAIISAGGYTRQSAIETADTKGDLIAFGRPFIGNVSMTCIPLRTEPLSYYLVGD